MECLCMLTAKYLKKRTESYIPSIYMCVYILGGNP